MTDQADQEIQATIRVVPASEDYVPPNDFMDKEKKQTEAEKHESIIHENSIKDAKVAAEYLESSIAWNSIIKVDRRADGLLVELGQYIEELEHNQWA